MRQLHVYVRENRPFGVGTLKERRETATSLKDKHIRMEQQVYRIWTVLSAFEESSVAWISDMLQQVSNGQYLEAIWMAEKFILHVEALFVTIDDLEWHFAHLRQKGMSHVREARMLCQPLYVELRRPCNTSGRTPPDDSDGIDTRFRNQYYAIIALDERAQGRCGISRAPYE